MKPKNRFSLTDRAGAWLLSYGSQDWGFRRIRKYQDFIGVNFYNVNYVNGWRIQNPDTPLNDMGWYMEPAAIEQLTMKLWREYRLPLMITENGLADLQDKQRKWWLGETINALERSNKAGARVIGYLHWSLLDNFEWDKGWWPQFGLVHVDRKNGMKRTIRPSAKWYSQRIEKIT